MMEGNQQLLLGIVQFTHLYGFHIQMPCCLKKGTVSGYTCNLRKASCCFMKVVFCLQFGQPGILSGFSLKLHRKVWYVLHILCRVYAGDAGLRKHFENTISSAGGSMRSVKVAVRKGPDGKPLSMGFGFVECSSEDVAKAVLKQLQVSYDLVSSVICH